MSDFKRVGAAWRKKSRKGTDYVSISLNSDDIKDLDLSQMNIFMIKNNRKEKQSQPDYTISVSERFDQRNQEQRQQEQRPPPKQQQYKNYAPGSDDESEFP